MAIKTKDIEAARYWASMLDESAEEIDVQVVEFPENENAKFQLDKVFTSDIAEDAVKTKEILSKIWPNWSTYFINELNREPVKFLGRQTAPDDFDTISANLVDIYGETALIDFLLDFIYDDSKVGRSKKSSTSELTLKELIDDAIAYIYEYAEDDDSISIDDLERKGVITYKGKTW